MVGRSIGETFTSDLCSECGFKSIWLINIHCSFVYFLKSIFSNFNRKSHRRAQMPDKHTLDLVSWIFVLKWLFDVLGVNLVTGNTEHGDTRIEEWWQQQCVNKIRGPTWYKNSQGCILTWCIFYQLPTLQSLTRDNGQDALFGLK